MVLAPGYPNTTGFRKVVKMSVFIRKKAGMSDADFIEYYNNVHAQKAAPVVLKHGVLSYSLTYCLTLDRTRINDVLQGRATASLLPYEAICTFVFPTWLALARFMYDPKGKELAGDHVEFMDEAEMRYLVGDEYVLVEGGERVN